MRFSRFTSQTAIDVQLRRAKPRDRTPPLPWAPALFGLAVVVAMQMLL
jgi:hypothetical protein